MLPTAEQYQNIRTRIDDQILRYPVHSRSHRGASVHRPQIHPRPAFRRSPIEHHPPIPVIQQVIVTGQPTLPEDAIHSVQRHRADHHLNLPIVTGPTVRRSTINTGTRRTPADVT